MSGSPSHRLSPRVNVITPRYRSSRRAFASWSARQRTDLVATRIGFAPARASISSEFDHMASRSTNANGASRPANAASYLACAASIDRLWPPIASGGRVPEHRETVKLDGAEAEVTGVGEATVTELRFRPQEGIASR